MIRTAVSFVLLFIAFALISRAVFRNTPPPAVEIQSEGSERGQTFGPSPDVQPSPDPPASTRRSSGKKSSQVTAEKPATDPPAAEKPPAEKPAAEKPPAEKPAAEKPATKKPTAEESSVQHKPAEVNVAPALLPQGLADSKAKPLKPSKTYSLQAHSDDDFSPAMIGRRERIRDTMAYFYVRPENAARRSPWGVMHAIIAYGVETPLIVGEEEVNAVGWLCWNRPCRGMRLFRAPGGKIKTPIGPGFQGHEGQFLAMMAQSKVKRDYPMRIDGHEFTIDDLIEFEKRTCRSKSELTFKLIGLVHYLDSDAQWKSNTGETWNIPRLISEELDQPVIGAACGGTHRMMGFSYAVHKRRQRDEPFTGEWERARKFVNSYVKYTFQLQNRDGSFSTDWFRGRGNRGEIDRKIQTSGHMLEWLIFSLPDEDLTDPRVLRAVDFVNNALWNNRDRTLEVGPKGHALRALTLYDERVYRGKPGTRKSYLADRASNLKR
jgi:hypothetical protein